ncbi:MAG: tetratricopeptide repeat protein, partial [Alphaproteobacteria bacterium]|nr:tetratricopeptide repeat protein [Alphaproteobacteria bacterium]
LAGAWEKYGRYIIGLAVAIVVLVASVTGYDALRTGQREAASARYDALLTQISEAEADEKITRLLAFSAAEDNGYGALAQFSAALTQAEEGQYDNALEGFDALAGRRALPDSLRDFASLQAAIVLLDSGGSLADITDRIGGLAENENGLQPTAREIMALAFSAHDQPLEARDLLMQQIGDSSVNSLARDRASIMLQSVKGVLLALPEVEEAEGDE